MDLNKHIIDDVVVVSISGQLDGTNANDALAFFEAQYSENSTKVLADFKEVSFVSSAGLRVLLSVVKELRRMGGDLRLVALQPDVQKVLAATGFTRIFKIYDDLEAGVAAFSG